ncbi:polyprenyl synthetase family protein [Micromonospora sp. NPDC049559]|uniref:polyprenyl synthetase family protein n=1 Tax=Micromonospora sp. NPDC049559 TaxID=3155923 RepID=UPI00344A4576
MLARARRLVSAPLQDAVLRLEPDLARICGYHFGWSDRAGQPTGEHGAGKLLRASLALLAATGTGADPGRAVPGAVAVELIHNFSLIHDDIMDADEQRRGRPTAWVVFGTGLATLAGDALVAAALRQVEEAENGQRHRAHAILVAALTSMIDGQSADLALERRGVEEVSVEHYLRACDKTTALLEASTATGAVLAGAGEPTVAALREAARNLGLSWQVANDVEDIWGDTRVTGKPARSDLRRTKKTIPVILALRSGHPDGARLAGMLRTRTEEWTDDDLQTQADLIEGAGGRAAAEQLSRRYLDVALDHVGRAGLRPESQRELTELFRFVVR